MPCQRAYLEAIKSYYAIKTLQTMERGFRTIHGALLELKKEGKVSTTNPRRLTKNDIAAFLEWMRTRRTRQGLSLAHATQANYLNYLNGFLQFENNGVIDQMRKLHYVRFPQKVSTEVRVMPESRVEEIRSKLMTMPGYEGAVARLMVAMYAYSGLRRSELRQPGWRTYALTPGRLSWLIRRVRAAGRLRLPLGYCHPLEPQCSIS